MGITSRYDIIPTDHESVERFIERLSELAVDGWLSVAAACGEAEVDRSASLQALIDRHGLSVEAWSIVDDVETAVYCSLGPRGFAPSREGALLRLAREAANTAAVALLVRLLLRQRNSRRCTRPSRRWRQLGRVAESV